MDTQFDLNQHLLVGRTIYPRSGNIPKVYLSGKSTYVKLYEGNTGLYIGSVYDEEYDYVAILTLEKSLDRPATPSDKIKVTQVNYNSAKGLFV